MTTILLAKADYEADSAETGTEVLEALRRQTYDIILMDIQMPEMDGLQATRQIRREWPVEQWPWIIAVTGDVTGKDRETCLAAGMDDYISKPLHEKTLKTVLEHSHPYTIDKQTLASALSNRALPATTGPTGEASKGTLDSKVVECLQDSFGPELLVEFIDIFLEDAPALLTEMHEGLSIGEAESVQRAAHTLKSNTGALGATIFSELCQRAEVAGKRGDLVAAGPLTLDIEREYPRVQEALQILRMELST
ncbi:MAG: response regulator [Longispora sp.]|nr:response regulator [Longispora sp. (in: high G+C Gram-positive bacteria)]